LNTKTIKTNSLIVLKSIIIIVAVNVNNQIYWSLKHKAHM